MASPRAIFLGESLALSNFLTKSLVFRSQDFFVDGTFFSPHSILLSAIASLPGASVAMAGEFRTNYVYYIELLAKINKPPGSLIEFTI
jgi:hypothetical protein